MDIDDLCLLGHAVGLAGDNGRDVGAVTSPVRVVAIGRRIRPEAGVEAEAGPYCLSISCYGC